MQLITLHGPTLRQATTATEKLKLSATQSLDHSATQVSAFTAAHPNTGDIATLSNGTTITTAV